MKNPLTTSFKLTGKRVTFYHYATETCSRRCTHCCNAASDTRTARPKRTTGNPSVSMSSYTFVRLKLNILATCGMLSNKGCNVCSSTSLAPLLLPHGLPFKLTPLLFNQGQHMKVSERKGESRHRPIIARQTDHQHIPIVADLNDPSILHAIPTLQIELYQLAEPC